MATNKSSAKTKTSPMKTKSPELPNVKDHLVQSWEMMVGSLKNLLLLWLVMFGVIMGLVAIVMFVGFGAISAAGGFSVFESPENFLKLLASPAAGVFVFISILVGIAYSVFAAGIGASLIISLAKYKDKLSFSTVFSKGMKLALPVFLLGLVSGLLTFGGAMLFIVPGIVIAVFLSFSMFEKVLENKSMINSFKGSYIIVRENFGVIFVRWLVVVGFYLLFFGLVPEILGAISEGLRDLYGSITGLAGIVINWIIMAYFLILYREVRMRTNMSQPINITWIWLVGGIGWLLVLIFGVTLANRIPKMIDYMQQADEYSEMQTDEDFQMMMDELGLEDMDGSGEELQLNFDMDTEELTPEQQQAIEEAQAAMEEYMRQMQDAADTGNN